MPPARAPGQPHPNRFWAIPPFTTFNQFKTKGKIIMSDESNPETTAEAKAANHESASKLNDGKQHASQAVHDLRAAAEAKAAELRATAEAKAAEFRAQAEDLRGRAEQAYTDYRGKAQTFRSDSEHWIRENPTRAVLTALGVGFVVGLMFRK
jgi:ElaB/YqjD/DUF883 family membrane-anchored ribosome-binding protein